MKKYSIIIYLILAVGIFFVIIDPQYKEVQTLLKVKSENDGLLVKATHLTKKREELMGKYNSISAKNKADLRKILPETVDNVRLVRDINNIAKDSAIVIRGIAISGDISNQEEDSRVVDNSGKNYGVIQLSFSFSADYASMKRFLKELENSLRLVDIRTLSVTASQVDDVYSYSLTLDTYWLR